MKIYRCKLEFNNADTCEWEHWDEFASEWYTDKSLAKQHMPEFRKALKKLKKEVYVDYIELFKYHGPYIEEAEVRDEFVPIDLKIF